MSGPIPQYAMDAAAWLFAAMFVVAAIIAVVNHIREKRK